MSEEIVSSWCNACSRDTEHDVLWKDISGEEEPDGSRAEDRVLALRCRGCKDCVILSESVYIEQVDFEQWDETVVRQVYKPARLWRRRPSWLNAIEEIDPDIKGLMEEVYMATNDHQVRLLSMGVRAVLDHLMIRVLGKDVGPFERKLEAMVRAGALTDRQRQNLEIVIDAGSASTHRSFKPPRELLEQMLAVMEALVHDYYITGPMLETAKTLIPPRPPRA